MVRKQVHFPPELVESLDQTRRPTEAFADVVRAACIHWVDHHEKVHANRRFYAQSVQYRLQRLESVVLWCTVFLTFVVLEVGLTLIAGLLPGEAYQPSDMVSSLLRLTAERGDETFATLTDLTETKLDALGVPRTPLTEGGD
jgi:hypothetical protein